MRKLKLTRARQEQFLKALAETGSVATSAAIQLKLSADAFARKLAAARRYEPLRDEYENAVATVGLDAFGVECFWPTPRPVVWFRTGSTPPYYERHGERRVAEGCYPAIVRYGQHLEPLIAHVASWAEGPVACVA